MCNVEKYVGLLHLIINIYNKNLYNNCHFSEHQRRASRRHGDIKSRDVTSYTIENI